MRFDVSLHGKRLPLSDYACTRYQREHDTKVRNIRHWSTLIWSSAIYWLAFLWMTNFPIRLEVRKRNGMQMDDFTTASTTYSIAKWNSVRLWQFDCLDECAKVNGSLYTNHSDVIVVGNAVMEVFMWYEFLDFVVLAASQQMIRSNQNSWIFHFISVIQTVCFKCSTYDWRQCAAVKVHFSFRIEHPQICPIFITCSEHWYGAWPSAASVPPTIRRSSEN